MHGMAHDVNTSLTSWYRTNADPKQRRITTSPAQKHILCNSAIFIFDALSPPLNARYRLLLSLCLSAACIEQCKILLRSSQLRSDSRQWQRCCSLANHSISVFANASHSFGAIIQRMHRSPITLDNQINHVWSIELPGKFISYAIRFGQILNSFDADLRPATSPCAASHRNWNLSTLCLCARARVYSPDGIQFLFRIFALSFCTPFYCLYINIFVCVCLCCCAHIHNVCWQFFVVRFHRLAVNLASAQLGIGSTNSKFNQSWQNPKQPFCCGACQCVWDVERW